MTTPRPPSGPELEFRHVLEAAQAGEHWAVAELWRRHQPRLLRYLRAYAHDDAEDVASDTWMSVARGLERFRGDADAFRAWLFTIARRRVVDRHRSMQRRAAAPAADPPAVEAPSAESEAIRGALGDEAARRILSLLPDEHAEVVLLRVVAGLSVAQVAEMTGRRPGTVRVVQHRALRHLASVLGSGPDVTPEDVPTIYEADARRP